MNIEVDDGYPRNSRRLRLRSSSRQHRPAQGDNRYQRPVAGADLVGAAERHLELSGSAIQPFGLALAADLDEQLRSEFLGYR
jgi:hypothetical protein